MNQEARIMIFKETTALLSGHFSLTSGLHTPNYVAKRRLYTRPLKVSGLCYEVAEHFKHDNVEVVVSPAVGGVALSQWVAAHLTDLTGREVLAVFADKVGDKKEFTFSEGCGEFLVGKRVLVVDDVLTTGGSIEAVYKVVQDVGGILMGASVLWLRGKMEIIDVPFFALITKNFPTFKPEECPLCANHIPFDKLK
ncbi:MAG: phosphoribosyltransferase family protein [Candidatus Nealsonbacteria bacterium]